MMSSCAARLLAIVGIALLCGVAPPATPAFAREAKSFFSLPGFGPARKTERRPARRAKRPDKGAKRSQPKPAKAASPAVAPVTTRPPTFAPVSASPADDAAWRALLAAAPVPPEAGPALPVDGPAPAPPSPLALAALMPKPQPAPATPPGASASSELPPLPPKRPAGLDEHTTEAAPADEGAGVPLPPERSAALNPRDQPAEAKPVEPTPPDMPLPLVAREDDPDCRALDADEGHVAVTKPLPSIEGPGVCGAGPLVELSGVRRADGGVVEIKPAATLRCAMARMVATYVREDLAPAASGAGANLTRVDIAGSYVCRGRNNVVGGKLSEHGRANAMDISGLELADGRTFDVFAKDMPAPLAAVVKGAACDRFNTVLGPGSDGFHEDHLHVDLQPRRNHGKLCQWTGSGEANAR